MGWGLARISSRELSEWQAFDQREPIGGRRLDVHSAQILAMLANIHRDRKDRPDPFEPAEFLAEWWPERAEPVRPGRVNVEELSPKEQVAWLDLLNASFGGRDLRD